MLRENYKGVPFRLMGGNMGIVAGLMAVVILSGPSGAAPEAQALEPSAPRADWSHGLRVHRLVEQWVSKGKVPDLNRETDPPEQSVGEALPQVKVSELVGVRVTLRWAGNRSIGVGDILENEIKTAPDSVTDLVIAVRRATQRALNQARKKIHDYNLRLDDDARAKRLDFNRVKRDLLVDLQLAKTPTPLVLDADAPNEHLYISFSAGYHGLFMVLPEDSRQSIAAASVWPATSIARNATSRHQIIDLLSQLNQPIGQLGAVARPGGPRLWRFEVIHLVRPARNQPVERLVRGNKIVPDQVNLATVDALADRLAAHLATRLRRPKMAGTFQPANRTYDPELAEADDLALTAFVLARRSRVLPLLNPGGQEMASVLEATRQAVEQSEQILGGEVVATASPKAMGLLLMALIEAPHLAQRRVLRDKLGAGLMRLQTDEGRFLKSPIGDALVPTTTQAVLFVAMARLYDQTRDRTVGDAASRSRLAAWRLLETEPRLGALSWILEGEQVAVSVGGGEAGLSHADLPDNKQRAALVSGLLEKLLARQITEPLDTQFAPADVVGGFDRGTSMMRPGAVPELDWKTAEALAFLALACRDPQFCPPHNRDDYLLRSAQACRFIAQLMFIEPICFFMQDTSHVLGGVRSSLTDNRLEVAATATSLLAATELQLTYKHLLVDENR